MCNYNTIVDNCAIFAKSFNIITMKYLNNNKQFSPSKQHQFTPERIDLLRRLSERPDIYERLAHALAPSIYENDDVKKGILLQLFGGTKKTSLCSGRGAFR